MTRSCRTLIAIVIVMLAGTSLIPVLAADQSPRARAQAAERLEIRYLNGAYEILSRRPLRVVLPPSMRLPGEKGELSGFWIEVRSPSDDLIYRRVMQHPVPTPVEWVEQTEGGLPGRMRREVSHPDEKIFSVIVPEAPVGSVLVIYETQDSDKESLDAVVESARLVISSAPIKDSDDGQPEGGE